MLTTTESLNEGKVVPVSSFDELVWAEIKFSNGDIFYCDGIISNPAEVSIWSIAKSKKDIFHTGEENDSNCLLPGDEFFNIEDNNLRIALSKSMMRYTGGWLQFGDNDNPNDCSYVKTDEFKNFISSQQYKDYRLMFNDPDFKENGINSGIFKEYEKKYMLPNCEKRTAEHDSDVTSYDIASLGSSGSGDDSVKARSVGTQADSMTSVGMEVQTTPQ